MIYFSAIQYVNSGDKPTETMAAREEYPETLKTINQITNKLAPSETPTGNMQPNAVETALPPLNL